MAINSSIIIVCQLMFSTNGNLWKRFDKAEYYNSILVFTTSKVAAATGHNPGGSCYMLLFPNY